MIIQSIIFPENEHLDASPLYYNCSCPIQIINKRAAVIPTDCQIEFFSFFNALSIKRWKAFTILKQCIFKISTSGSGIIRLFYATRNTYQLYLEKPFNSETFEEYEFNIPLNPDFEFCYLVLETKSQKAAIQYAYFEAIDKPTRNVKIAISFCTFRREEYITNNLNLICHDILENSDSPLRDFLHVYVIDNGKTLKPKQIPHSSIMLVPNANTGGTGGFTRGLIEVMNAQRKYSYTHILLMDDDIYLETETLTRTFALLNYIKDIYCSAIVGGAMLRNDMPCVLEEAGANWPGKLQSLGRGWDMGQRDNLFRYNALGNAEYQAWWYCCIPLSILGYDNLPLPFFIHCDDTEYGLRNFKYILQLNGICVWHNTFENKRPSNLEYYDVRNHLILNALYDNRTSLLRQILGLFKRSTAMILRMRYQDVLLNIQGINDFLKGPKWWKNQDIAKLHTEILNQGYRYEVIPESLDFKNHFINEKHEVSFAKRIICFLTLNGALFPKKKRPIIIACGANPFLLYRYKYAYLWDPATNKAICVRFSLKKLVKMYGLLLVAFSKLIKNYSQIKQQYKNEIKFLESNQYWKRYIDT